MFTPKEFEPQDIHDAIMHLGVATSSSDDIEVLSQRPLDVLLYKEILKFDKEQLESVTSKHKEKKFLLNTAYSKKNYFIFSAFIQKGAFVDDLSPFSQWILKATKDQDIPLKLYENIFHLENDSYYQNNDLLYKQFNTFMAFFTKFNEHTEFKENLLNKFYKDHGKKFHTYIIDFIYQNIVRIPDVCDLFLTKIKESHIDINKNFPLNKILPEVSSWSKEDEKKTGFFISSQDIPRLKSLLEKGFKFDENKYEFAGQNLLTAVLNSGRVDLVETILPYINKFMPLDQDLDNQSKLIEKYQNKPSYENIKLIYFKAIYQHYDNLLPVKENATDSKKLKI
jgi:hypothetical protein